MNVHEQGFCDFLVEPGRTRMRTLLQLGAKRRKDVRVLLDHAIVLNKRYSEHLIGALHLAGSIEQRLRTLGAPPTCHVISASPELDDQELQLKTALQSAIGRGHGTYLSCLPGRLGYFEYEGPKSGFLLRRAD